jgi:hypothetical protein
MAVHDLARAGHHHAPVLRDFAKVAGEQPTVVRDSAMVAANHAMIAPDFGKVAPKRRMVGCDPATVMSYLAMVAGDLGKVARRNSTCGGRFFDRKRGIRDRRGRALMREANEGTPCSGHSAPCRSPWWRGAPSGKERKVHV